MPTPDIDVLLPTCNRPGGLIFALAGLAAQSLGGLRLVVADQSSLPACDSPPVRALCRIIEGRGGEVQWHERTARLGIAEQRQFLLQKAQADLVLYLDDDVYMEPWVLGVLRETIVRERCGFVGAFPTGLSFRDDVRPEQQQIEYWDGPVAPEIVAPDLPSWERAQLHRAAKLWHVAQHLPEGVRRLYRVAWVASCVLYDRRRLEAVGGFGFWQRLPRYHSKRCWCRTCCCVAMAAVAWSLPEPTTRNCRPQS